MIAPTGHLESAILNRVVAPEPAMLPRAVAEEPLKWTFPASDAARMSDLAHKARLGELTEEERHESESYERIASFLGIVKAKARRSLKTGGAVDATVSP